MHILTTEERRRGPHCGSLQRAAIAAATILGFSACAAETFTVAVIGDQQVPVANTTYYPSFTAQTDWLAANAQSNNIRFVSQVGDIVEHGGTLTEWDRAEAAMAVLDAADNADGGTGVTWSVAYGNHEQDSSQPGTDPAGAWAHRYREYFGSADGSHRYEGQDAFGGVSSNDLNTYHVITSSDAPDARSYLWLTLEYDVPGHVPGSTPDPGDVPAFDAIAWAQGVIDQHPGMPTIICTHVFEGTAFGPPNSPYKTGPGRNSQLQIFDKLVKDNVQVFLIVSGHTSQETHQVKQNAAGLDVLQIVTDYNKWLPNGGDGFMRLIEIDEGAGQIRVKTFTPGVPQNPTPRYRTDANGQFSIELDWATRFVSVTGPVMGAVSTTAVADDGATVQGQLLNDDADDVTLVWAYEDQGETTVATWTAAAGGGSYSFGPAVANDVLIWALTGLNGDRAYRYRFFATAGAVSDWSAPDSFATGLRNRPAPADLVGAAGTVVGGTRVDLTWNDIYNHETGFVIQRSTDAGFAVFDEYTAGADQTAFTDATTDPNTTYHYRIAAVGITGTGPFSAAVEVTTGEAGTGIDGLTGYWKFDDGLGTTATDSSGNGYDLDQVNADGSWTTGKAGGAYHQPRFTADATESDALNLAGGGTVTLSLWVTMHSTAQFGGMAGFEGTGNTGDIWGFKMDNTDHPQWTVLPSHGPFSAADTLANYAAATPDGWVHLVGVFEQGVASTLYVNGSPAGIGAAGSPIADKTPPGLFRIGTYYNSNSYEFNGSIDDVQLYGKALSPDDISWLFSHPGKALGEGTTSASSGTLMFGR